MICTLCVVVAGVCLSVARAEDDSSSGSNTVSARMEQAREDAKKMSLPANRYSEAGRQAAEQTAKTYHSTEFQERLQCEQQRLEQEVFREHTAPWKQKRAQEQPGDLAAKDKIYLFFSSSVPEDTVRTYIATLAWAKTTNIVPVLRGLVQGRGNINASADYFAQILQEDPDCRDKRETMCRRYQVPIKIDPTLFERYGITRVPAVVYAGEKDSFKIQGDAGLDYLLERINRDAKSTTLAKLINQLRGPH
ncbi:MAG: TrbC family F-type conjugative pilus assembly protein [Desulfobulbaceae bacterium]